ncbi:MAG: pirin family protein [Herminiimonas sp.]|nr:pirin family protein [Herminiimonas sp.]
MLELRKSEERGHANHGWLDSYHSFSFADYYDPQYMGFGPLRVINDDRIEAGAGFGTHGHRDMEIITYMLDGALEHKDSMGTGSVIRPGDVQRMSAGRGVQHSEFNHSKEAGAHLLQIWIEPNVKGIAPSYEEKNFERSEKDGKLRLIASPQGEAGSVMIHQDARVYAGLFDVGQQSEITVGADRLIYVHIARGTALVNGQELTAGDALKVRDESAVRVEGRAQAEILVFDLPR